jgi:hypothetical protein
MIAADLTSVPHRVLFSAFVAVGAFAYRAAKPVWQWMRDKLPAIRDILLGKTESKAGSFFSITGGNRGYIFNNCTVNINPPPRPPTDGEPPLRLPPET